MIKKYSIILTIIFATLMPSNLLAAAPQQESTAVVNDAPPPSVADALTDITGKQNSLLQRRLQEESQVVKNPFGILLYQPNYILPFYYTQTPDQSIRPSTPDNERVQSAEFKGQLSFKVPVTKNLFNLANTSFNIAYTQLMYWQVYAKSQYFRETDYAPEMFVSYQPQKNWMLNFGAVHQSNGRGGSYERSWNRVYGELLFSGQNWLVSVKPWVLIFKNESSDLHNSNITRYMGNGEVRFVYQIGDSEISFMSRNNLQSGFSRGAEELDWSYHLWQHFYLYTQLFSGYGQSLIEYNHYTNAAGIGIALNNFV